MSKGKRKSNPEALKLVRQRLQCDQRVDPPFREEDRDLLMQLCRLDLIQILEEDLGMPLKASNKNSVACMVDFLLSRGQQRSSGRSGQRSSRRRRSSGSNTPGQAGPSSGSPRAGACAADTPSSGGGSCLTPSTTTTDQQGLQHQSATPPSTTAAPAEPPAAVYPDQPWLAELHYELEAAGAMRCLGDDTTDTDDDGTGTEADSSWLPSLSGAEGLQRQASLADGSSQGLQAGALDTSQVEEMLVQQLLLDIRSVPRRPSRRGSSLHPAPQQQQQLQEVAEVQEPEERQPPPLLQQKLQQLDAQQQALKQQQEQQAREQQHQQRQQQLLKLQLQQQQQLQQEMLWMAGVQQQQAAADFDMRLQDELLLQLGAAADAGQQVQVPPCDRMSLEPPALPASTGLPAAAAAAAAGAAGPPLQLPAPSALGTSAVAVKPEPLTTWPLPSVTGQASLPTATAGWDGELDGLGLSLRVLSDASLPLTLQQPGGRLSVDGGSSFVRKRDKMLRELLAPREDRVLDEFKVEPSGPSADLPTKRMSLTLPGSGAVGSLPTSFSGRVPSVGGVSRPLPSDLQGLMQLSNCEDLADAWQHQGAAAGQQEECMPLDGAAAGGGGSGSVMSRMKSLLRGKKAKARRHNSVGAGTSFTSFTGSAVPPASRIHSADAALEMQDAAAADSCWGQVAMQGRQAGPWGAPHCGGSAGWAQGGGAAPPAAGARMWHSATMPGAYPAPGLASPATVAGFSWNGEGATTLAGASMTLQQPAAPGGLRQPGSAQHLPAGHFAALPVGAAGSDSRFAQQLSQLRAVFGEQHPEPAASTWPAPAQAAGGALGSESAGTSTALAGAGFPGGAPCTAAATSANGSMGPTVEQPGLVGKLARVLKLSSQQDTLGCAAPAPAAAGMSTCEEDEELLVMGRTDGQLDLGATLQWQAAPVMGLLGADELLEGFAASVPDGRC